MSDASLSSLYLVMQYPPEISETCLFLAGIIAALFRSDAVNPYEGIIKSIGKKILSIITTYYQVC